VDYDESYSAERRGRRYHDPWLAILHCRHGHIYPHGGDLLGAATAHHSRIARQLIALRCCRLIQDGDDGVNVVFHIDDFCQVAEIMKPRRRRRLTAEQRADQAERLRKYQFSSATHDTGDERRRDAGSSVA